MKIQTTSKIRSGILIAFLAFGVATARAETFSTSSFGIALGQTARLNFLNFSDREILVVAGRFVDSDGTLLNDFRGEVAPRTTMSFDLNRDSISRETNRLQVHVEIESPRPNTKHALPSLEIFSNADFTTMAANYSSYRFIFPTQGGNRP